jgi:lysophospholipase L1-like esterase
MLVLNRFCKSLALFGATAALAFAAIYVPPSDQQAAKKKKAKTAATAQTKAATQTTTGSSSQAKVPAKGHAQAKTAQTKPTQTKTLPKAAPVLTPSQKAQAKPSVVAPKTSAASAKPSISPTAKTPVRRATIRPAAITAKDRAAGQDFVYQNASTAADIPVERSAALIPFFEQLYRHQKGESPGPIRILHYGDSHTAADEWTGDLRNHFQEKFGDGGAGYSLPGKPFTGYRHNDIRTSSTRGWHTDGLVGKPAGDGIYGLGGVSMSARMPREAVYLDAEASMFELFYYQQPDGGTIQIYDNGVPLERVSTAGDPGPAYFHFEAVPGPHRMEVETVDKGPVRLFGWVAEKPTGVTYEPLGINGAQASIVFDWNETTLRSNIERRDPALIVLAYGTNEAGRKDITLESYRSMFTELIAKFRRAAPAATILVVGPPDRDVRTRRGAWEPIDTLDIIVEAQREAAAAQGCPFWDMRAKMGGKGSMQQWVNAGMAQYDHVHFTAPGYRMLSDAIFRDLMSQYDIFLKARADILAADPSPIYPARPTPAMIGPAIVAGSGNVESAQQ